MISIQTPSGPVGLILRGIRTPAGNKAIASGKITTPGGSRTFWDGSNVGTISSRSSPTYTRGGAAVPTAVTIVTSPVTVITDGGAAPFTYSWSLASSSGGTWNVTDPGKVTTSFECFSVAPKENFTATFECVVTDARGATDTATVTAVANNYGGV